MNKFNYQQTTSEDGSRIYDINNSTYKLASVTTIVNAVKPKVDFTAWRNKVGEEAAKAPSKRGNALHNLVEFHYDDKIKISDVTAGNKEAVNCFDRIKPLLNIIEPFAIEEKTHWLDNSGMGFAGTLDIGGYIDASKLQIRDVGLLGSEKVSFIGDWKTWNKAKYPIGNTKDSKYYPLISYCLQLSAYCAAFNQRTSLAHRINKGFIFGVTENCRQPFIYYVNPDAISFYWNNMKEIVKCYYSKSYFNWNDFEQSAEYNGFLGERVDLIL